MGLSSYNFPLPSDTRLEMYGENGTSSHDFVSEFVELPGGNVVYDFDRADEHAKLDRDAASLQELFYSPMLSAAPGSAEPTPLMTPNDHTFAMPPSYFSPSLSPGPHGGSEMPEFELPKKAVGTPSSSRVTKQKSLRRSANKWQGPQSQSRHNSTSSSVQQSRHNSSASPQTASDENDDLLGGAAAVTPASLMNVSIAAGSVGNPDMDHHLGEALLATAQTGELHELHNELQDMHRTERRFSGASQSSASSLTPAIRPRRQQHSAHSSPALAPYRSPAIAPHDADVLLASKSNYQNIMEGKHQQLGLQYPERLTQDITSKKASHKIAEQERRNRINVAISELGRIVAPEMAMTSKAATVEAAISYIKGLQEEIRELKRS